jgi:hypothetical protein
MIHPVVHGSKLSSSQISVAAEAFAAAQFALSGFDVLEQYGRTRSFNLAVAKSGGMLRVSVYFSFSGFWDLVDRYLDSSKPGTITTADYHCAIKRWLDNQSSRVTCCLVEFDPADVHRLPRIYLAEPVEVAEQLYDMIDQLGSEEVGAVRLDIVHRLEGLPASWRFSQARLSELMDLPQEQETSFAARPSSTTACKDASELLSAAYVDCSSLMN